jgi:flavin reductase (DIM6/NTAB) family NADH-FMN oxidoreductase RutF
MNRLTLHPWTRATAQINRNGARCNSTTSHQNISQHLREVLRETAQPVAVVTSLMPFNTPPKFHGSTLSSFTSIAMEPYPLVTFSLRVPSRMATSLKSPQDSAHMVINLLCAEQSSTAIRFSRPDLHPEPFAATPFFLSQEGIPVLKGCLGALSCQMVPGSWPLHDLHFLAKNRGVDKVDIKKEAGRASELFIARVVRVEGLFSDDEGDGLRKLPLLYHRRAYTTTSRDEPLDHQPFNSKIKC